MLARLFHTQPVPSPPNQRCFPKSQEMERILESPESTGKHSPKAGCSARLSPPAYSAATQSVREHVVREYLALERRGRTDPELGGKKKHRSQNWEAPPMDQFYFRRRNCLASDTRSAGRERSEQMRSRPPVKTELLPDPTRLAERSAGTKE